MKCWRTVADPSGFTGKKSSMMIGTALLISVSLMAARREKRRRHREKSASPRAAPVAECRPAIQQLAKPGTVAPTTGGRWVFFSPGDGT